MKRELSRIIRSGLLNFSAAACRDWGSGNYRNALETRLVDSLGDNHRSPHLDYWNYQIQFVGADFRVAA